MIDRRTSDISTSDEAANPEVQVIFECSPEFKARLSEEAMKRSLSIKQLIMDAVEERLFWGPHTDIAAARIDAILQEYAGELPEEERARRFRALEHTLAKIWRSRAVSVPMLEK